MRSSPSNQRPTPGSGAALRRQGSPLPGGKTPGRPTGQRALIARATEHHQFVAGPDRRGIESGRRSACGFEVSPLRGGRIPKGTVGEHCTRAVASAPYDESLTIPDAGMAGSTCETFQNGEGRPSKRFTVLIKRQQRSGISIAIRQLPAPNQERFPGPNHRGQMTRIGRPLGRQGRPTIQGRIINTTI